MTARCWSEIKENYPSCIIINPASVVVSPLEKKQSEINYVNHTRLEYILVREAGRMAC